MTSSAAPVPPGDSTAELAAPTAREPLSGDLRRLLRMYLPANIGVYLVWGAIPTVLLPLQLTAVDAANKVTNLSIVTVIGAAAGMIAQPLAGRFSDRTRSRFGRRTPWLLLGSLIGGLALVGMALARGIAEIAIAWAIAQIAYNFVQGPLTAVLPDRVPASARGLFSAFIGLGAMIGSLGGQILGSGFAQNVGAAYVLIAGIALVTVTLFVVFAREEPSLGVAREPLGLREFLNTFWFNPVAHPDLAWAFAGRILLYSGYYLVSGYNLYILEDYLKLSTSEATAAVALVAFATLAGMIPSIVLGGVISDRIGRRKIMVFVASVICSVSLVIPLVSPTLAGLLLSYFIGGIGFGAFQSVDQALVSEVLPSEESLGKDLGIVNVAAALPKVITPSIGGIIVLGFGYAGLFVAGILLTIIGAFAVFLIRGVK